jgi:predicted DNA-binding antitoxin AbrB/MazE fold protein
MGDIEAVFRHGVFHPLAPVNVRDDQKVRLRIESSDLHDDMSAALEWLRDVQTLQAEIRQRRGDLPDSSIEIAADRAR